MLDKKINILLIADRQLGGYLINKISSDTRFKIVAVLTDFVQSEKKWYPGPSPKEICSNLGISMFDTNNLNTEKLIASCARPDYSLAVLNNNFRSKEFLEWSGKAINIHGAPLPNYQGNNCTHFAILNNETFFGMTAYLTTEEVDVGPIVAKNLFKIPESCTNKQLHELTFTNGCEIIDVLAEQMCSGSIKIIEEFDHSKAKWYDQMGSREIDSNSSEAEAEKIIRAFYFPPFEPAYIIANGNKHFFTK